MKHTDFYKLIEETKLQEQRELKAAIKSVGGCYIWDIYDSEAEYPIIAVNMDSISLNPTDVEIYLERVLVQLLNVANLISTKRLKVMVMRSVNSIQKRSNKLIY